MQRNNKPKIALVRVRLALLTHVVGRCFAEMQTPNRELYHLLWTEVHSVWKKLFSLQ